MRIHLSKMGLIVSLLVVMWWALALAQSAGGVTMSSQVAEQGWTENFESGTPSNWEFFSGAGVVQSVQDPKPLKSGSISFRAVGGGGTEIDDLVRTPGLVSGGGQTVQQPEPAQ